jgi:hypothetical protein
MEIFTMKKVLGMIVIIMGAGVVFSACTYSSPTPKTIETPQMEKIEEPTSQSTEVDSLEKDLGSMKLEDESFE